MNSNINQVSSSESREPFLNAKRRRDYPRLMLIATWLVMGLNLIFHQGWIGAFGQVISGDFIMFYSTGSIYRSSPNLIYDYETQSKTQQALVSPTILPGYNPYMNPPYVAPIYSLLTFVQLNAALLLWSILAIASVFLSALLLVRLIPIDQKKSDQSYVQIIIITLSFFPFIEGMLAGQNHWLTLLLSVGIVYCMLREKLYMAGILAGFLIYKPQFVLGFLILWLFWRKFKALVSFVAISAVWVGIFTLINGLDLFQTYRQLSQVFMNLPYIAGFPNYLLVTFYGLLTSFFPESTQHTLSILSQILFVISSIGLAALAYLLRNKDMHARIPLIVAALLIPLVATPYALLHDMVLLIPAFVLWGIYDDSIGYVNISTSVYLGAFLLTMLGAVTKIAWVSLLTIGLYISLIAWAYTNRHQLAEAHKTL